MEDPNPSLPVSNTSSVPGVVTTDPSAPTTAGTTIKGFTRLAVQTVTLADDAIAGKILFALPIDVNLTEDFQALGKTNTKYRPQKVAITIGNVSPTSTASGAVYLCFEPDPDNKMSNLLDNYNENLEHATRLTQTKLMRARDTITFDLDLSACRGRRYCKATGTPRLESFGTFYIVALAPPEVGDGTRFQMDVAAHYEFYDITVNTAQVVNVVNAVNVDLGASKFTVDNANKTIKMTSPIFEALPPKSMHVHFPAGARVRCKGADNYYTDVQFHKAVVNPDGGGGVYFKLNANTKPVSTVHVPEVGRNIIAIYDTPITIRKPKRINRTYYQ